MHPLRSVERHGGGYPAAASWLQRNGVLVFHMACRITAIFRATAILAFLKPDAFASFRPQALSVETGNL